MYGTYVPVGSYEYERRGHAQQKDKTQTKKLASLSLLYLLATLFALLLYR
jgi:hypothetical protein